MNSVQKPDAPQAQMLNRGPLQQLSGQISSAYQNSPMSTVFGPIFDRTKSAMDGAFAPITSAIQNRQAQPQQMPLAPSQPPALGVPTTQPMLPTSQPMTQFPGAVRALWGRR